MRLSPVTFQPRERPRLASHVFQTKNSQEEANLPLRVDVSPRVGARGGRGAEPELGVRHPLPGSFWEFMITELPVDLLRVEERANLIVVLPREQVLERFIWAERFPKVLYVFTATYAVVRVESTLASCVVRLTMPQKMRPSCS